MSENPTADRHDNQGYPGFCQLLVNAVARSSRQPLFTTNAGDLFTTFLAELPPEERAGYTCTACKHFFNTYGNLVFISEESGEQYPVLFSAEDVSFVPEFFFSAWTAMKTQVRRAAITGVFISEERIWGTPTNADKKGRTWTHFHGIPRRESVFVRGVLTAGQRAAELREDYAVLRRATEEFSMATATAAQAMSASDVLYRAERVRPVAAWFHALMARLGAVKEKHKGNILWRAVATAPAGFAHVRNTMIGTLLADIEAGNGSFADIQARFETKMAPDNYQRPTAPPNAGNVAVAEKLVRDLGLAAALPRRYATLHEVAPYAVWQPLQSKTTPSKCDDEPESVFRHVPIRQKKPSASPASAVVLPSQTMTWARFARDVLPNAAKIEAKIANDTRFMALTTAVDPSAPPILAWDDADARNPFSWYYQGGGIDGEFKRRVEAAGGRFENVDIRATLIWNNRTDLDLHCDAPGGHISYMQKRVGQGWLDIDMNVSGNTDTPVENIRWLVGQAPAGHYLFSVVCFTNRAFDGNNPFQVQMQVGGRTWTVEGNARTSAYSRVPVVVAQFNYANGLAMPPFNVSPGVVPLGMGSSEAGVTASWNVEPGWAPVLGILPSPNLWGKRAATHYGEHVFFLVENCRDQGKGQGRGLITEALRGELRPARAVIEAYYNTAEIAESTSGESACGIGMKHGSPWNLELRVTDKTGSVFTYQIDRGE